MVKVAATTMTGHDGESPPDGDRSGLWGPPLRSPADVVIDLSGGSQVCGPVGTPPTGATSDVRPTFEALYLRLFDPMRRLAYVLVDTGDQATDVVQEAFARMYPKFDRIEHPEAYIRSVVLNTARRVVKRRGLDRDRVRPEPAAPPNPFDHVLDAIRRLPAPQRAAIVLRYYLQLTDDEIASTLGMRVGTVKSTLFRARERLKEELS